MCWLHNYIQFMIFIQKWGILVADVNVHFLLSPSVFHRQFDTFFSQIHDWIHFRWFRWMWEETKSNWTMKLRFHMTSVWSLQVSHFKMYWLLHVAWTWWKLIWTVLLRRCAKKSTSHWKSRGGGDTEDNFVPQGQCLATRRGASFLSVWEFLPDGKSAKELSYFGCGSNMTWWKYLDGYI